MYPATAEAAATAGEARYISDSVWPILPTKFLFEVETALSPFARIPIWPPRQGPQVGVETIAPASMNISVSPSFMQSR